MLHVDRTLTQLKKPQVIHEIIYFVQSWFEDKEFARVMVSSRRLTRFGEGEMARTYTGTSSVRKPNLTYNAQSTVEDNKVGTEDRLVQKFETSKIFGSVKYQIHPTTVIMPCQTTKVTRTTSIVELSIIERLLMPTNVINCLRLVHQTQRNHGQTDHGLKQTRHGKIMCKITARDIQKTYGTHQKTTNGDGLGLRDQVLWRYSSNKH